MPCFNVGYNRTFTLDCDGAMCERMLYGVANVTACRAEVVAMLALDTTCLLAPCLLPLPVSADAAAYCRC